jgi:hypothetical protein
MANLLVSIPVFLSSGTVTGYTCPADKRAIIKNIQVCNELTVSGVVSVYWTDANNVGIGSTLTDFPILISGVIPGNGRLRVLDEFLTIKEGDLIKLKTTTTNQLSCLFSVVEQDT